jgi:tetratricopeptide (TPR) repeat protein
MPLDRTAGPPHIPLRIWLLFVLAVLAFVPTRYLFRHVAHAPSRRDITRPPPDLSWRSRKDLFRNGAILVALAATAIFIFTPFAERIARKPQLLPIMIAGFGAWALFTVARGFSTGQIEPLTKGTWRTYDRSAQPKRFWASMAWNAFVGAGMIAVVLLANRQNVVESKCDYQRELPLEEKLSACNELIDGGRTDAYLYFERGMLFLNSGETNKAITDFTRAHEADPQDPWSLANRGIARAWKKDSIGAQADFDAVRTLDSSNPVMLRGESILKRDAGDLKGAVESLSASMARDPNNAWAMRARAEVYWELGDVEKSREDDTRWQQLMTQERAAQSR